MRTSEQDSVFKFVLLDIMVTAKFVEPSAQLQILLSMQTIQHFYANQHAQMVLLQILPPKVVLKYVLWILITLETLIRKNVLQYLDV